MHVEKLFATVKAKWPPLFDLSQAELVGRTGFLSWEMVRAQEQVEVQAIGEVGLIQAAIWSFHQALGEAALTKFISGERVVSRDEVDLELFTRFLREALGDSSWCVERETFSRDNPDF